MRPTRFRGRIARLVKGPGRVAPPRPFSRREARELALQAGLCVEREFHLFKEVGLLGSVALDRAAYRPEIPRRVVIIGDSRTPKTAWTYYPLVFDPETETANIVMARDLAKP